jgi:hypothetical protein
MIGGVGVALENPHVDTGLPQTVGQGQPGQSGTDDGDLHINLSYRDR